MEKTTPSGKKIVFKSSDMITARDVRELRALQDRSFNLTVDLVTQKPSFNSVNLGDVKIRQEELILSTAVVSFDGSSEGIVERLLSGGVADYDFAVEEATKLIAPPKAQE